MSAVKASERIPQGATNLNTTVVAEPATSPWVLKAVPSARFLTEGQALHDRLLAEWSATGEGRKGARFVELLVGLNAPSTSSPEALETRELFQRYGWGAKVAWHLVHTLEKGDAEKFRHDLISLVEEFHLRNQLRTFSVDSLDDAINREQQRVQLRLEQWSKLMQAHAPGFSAKEIFQDRAIASQVVLSSDCLVMPHIFGNEAVKIYDREEFSPWAVTKLNDGQLTFGFEYAFGMAFSPIGEGEFREGRLLHPVACLDKKLWDDLQTLLPNPLATRILDDFAWMHSISGHDFIHSTVYHPLFVDKLSLLEPHSLLHSYEAKQGALYGEFFGRALNEAPIGVKLTQLPPIESYSGGASQFGAPLTRPPIESYSHLTNHLIWRALAEEKPELVERVVDRYRRHLLDLQEWKKILTEKRGEEYAQKAATFFAAIGLERLQLIIPLQDPIWSADLGGSMSTSVYDAAEQLDPEPASLDSFIHKSSVKNWGLKQNFFRENIVSFATSLEAERDAATVDKLLAQVVPGHFDGSPLGPSDKLALLKLFAEHAATSEPKKHFNEFVSERIQSSPHSDVSAELLEYIARQNNNEFFRKRTCANYAFSSLRDTLFVYSAEARAGYYQIFRHFVSTDDPGRAPAIPAIYKESPGNQTDPFRAGGFDALRFRVLYQGFHGAPWIENKLKELAANNRGDLLHKLTAGYATFIEQLGFRSDPLYHETKQRLQA